MYAATYTFLLLPLGPLPSLPLLFPILLSALFLTLSLVILFRPSFLPFLSRSLLNFVFFFFLFCYFLFPLQLFLRVFFLTATFVPYPSCPPAVPFTASLLLHARSFAFHFLSYLLLFVFPLPPKKNMKTVQRKSAPPIPAFHYPTDPPLSHSTVLAAFHLHAGTFCDAFMLFRVFLFF